MYVPPCFSKATLAVAVSTPCDHRVIRYHGFYFFWNFSRINLVRTYLVLLRKLYLVTDHRNDFAEHPDLGTRDARYRPEYHDNCQLIYKAYVALCESTYHVVQHLQHEWMSGAAEHGPVQ